MRKFSFLLIVSLFSLISVIKCKSLYEYYTENGITSGLKANGDNFRLNDRPITIFSGSFHYFRVHPTYWRPILKKFKAVGLNAVDFYSPWNLHEETPGHFDFETGMLNVSDFLEAIREADMFAIYRPGPFICAEWDFGGLPAWLLRDHNMKIRTIYKPYMDAVDNYWKQLFAITKHFQFSSGGGPIIAVQMENELGSYGNTLKNPNDAIYMKNLSEIAIKYGMKELFFTSDGPGRQGSLDSFFRAINFKKNALNNLQTHKASYPNQPLFVGEYWTGWFDNWGGMHNTQNVSYFSEQFDEIVFQMNSSINFYMFYGGTNYGFMAGNVGRPDMGALVASVTTSYDYDAPLNESGNYTEKYWKIKELIEKFIRERNLTELGKVDVPQISKATNYGQINVTEQLSLHKILNKLWSYPSKYPLSMENINIGSNYGQNFGFTLYRTHISKGKVIKFTKGRVNDRAAVVVDNRQIAFVYAKKTSISVSLSNDVFKQMEGNKSTLDILCENLGRVDYGLTLNDMDVQRKGLHENITIDGKILKNWKLFVLQFKTEFIESLKQEEWQPIQAYKSPTFYRTTLRIEGIPRDTYLKMTDWTTSVVFINGFNIGRYWNVGPAHTLYVSAPFLKRGDNEIIIFETQSNGNQIEFIDRPIFQ